LTVEGDSLKDVRPVRLPYRSRNLNRLLKRLEPKRLESAGAFVWAVELTGRRLCCVVRGSEYRVEFSRVRVRDVLSGLESRLRVPKGLVDHKVVWEARWDGSNYVVDKLSCDEEVPC